MSVAPAIGFAAGTLTTLAYLPQALHSFRTRSVRDLSLAMLVALNAGLLLWVVYGFWIRSLPLILANVLTCTLAFPLLVMKLRFHKDESHLNSAIGRS